MRYPVSLWLYSFGSCSPCKARLAYVLRDAMCAKALKLSLPFLFEGFAYHHIWIFLSLRCLRGAVYRSAFKTNDARHEPTRSFATYWGSISSKTD
ncbi:hypothetical protein SCHPADRAFT_660780 [Schizopora paradoxa]|uniref:Uncharacterized protein n=1 Tax=Schizopora paradoxa TaxID=27342 RepID=A0A0H2RQS3_9AGAM|nr:hypothetical protein SCHPADRAFT_660780 [Schizopora paradoxa]